MLTILTVLTKTRLSFRVIEWTLHRSGHSHRAKSFETLNVIQVLYFLQRRQFGEVDSRHRAAGWWEEGHVPFAGIYPVVRGSRAW